MTETSRERSPGEEERGMPPLLSWSNFGDGIAVLPQPLRRCDRQYKTNKTGSSSTHEIRPLSQGQEGRKSEKHEEIRGASKREKNRKNKTKGRPRSKQLQQLAARVAWTHLPVGLVPCCPVYRLLPTFAHSGSPSTPPVVHPPPPFPRLSFFLLLLFPPPHSLGRHAQRMCGE